MMVGGSLVKHIKAIINTGEFFIVMPTSPYNICDWACKDQPCECKLHLVT